MLNQKLGLLATPTNIDGFVLDFNKGVYVDSRAMNEEQFTRYYRT